MYVVRSPELIAACDKRPSTVSFVPYVVEFARRILLANDESIRLLSEDLPEEKGADLRSETMKAMHRAMQPGKALDETIQRVMRCSIDFLDASIDIPNGKSLPLLACCRDFVTLASTDGLYGAEKNPFLNDAVMQGFWAVNKDFARLGLMLYPNLVAPNGSVGRQHFFAGMRSYYQDSDIGDCEYSHRDGVEEDIE
ncbi:hypothetical protein B0I35DRAFT_507907 [Stachybotrys elegans]|uniref:Uncharacterized protein n=1 Tax=Stachybotrys elegans TaxID=80388 RepID=A0A8K0T3R7_9HYPO|nr:hypothetical protein B0I35DRAFT_507907 [Stachybotrys elegans]